MEYTHYVRETKQFYIFQFRENHSALILISGTREHFLQFAAKAVNKHNIDNETNRADAEIQRCQVLTDHQHLIRQPGSQIKGKCVLQRTCHKKQHGTTCGGMSEFFQ